MGSGRHGCVTVCGKGGFEPIFRRNRAGDSRTDGVFCCISEKAASCKSVHRTEACRAGSDKVIIRNIRSLRNNPRKSAVSSGGLFYFILPRLSFVCKSLFNLSDQQEQKNRDDAEDEDRQDHPIQLENLTAINDQVPQSHL